MVKPNFLLIGGQRCGTTWLSEMIRQHPNTFAPPIKELHFFNNKTNFRKGIKWYQDQFTGYQGEKAVGEFTPNYLWVSLTDKDILDSDHNWDIPRLVCEYYPNIKLLVSLRDPVRRAISAYYHHMRRRRYAPTKRVMEVGHHYGIISMGFYYSHLCEWFKFFAEDQFLILIYEQDIVQNPERTAKRVYHFLETDENFKPTNLKKRYYARRGHLYTYLNYYFPKFAKHLLQVAPWLQNIDFPKISVTDEEIKCLSNIYADENKRLETLLGRRLSWT